MFEEDNGGVATAEPSQPFDVSKLLEQAKAAAQPPQTEQPAFNVDRLLSDAKAVAAGKPTQGERFAAAENWAAQRRGSEKVLGGVGVRDILENSIPFASTKIRFDKNRDYMAAKEAFDKGTATDEQLGKIAEFEYDRQRAAARTGIGQKIAYGLTSAPGIAGEAIMGGQALGAAGRALGFGQRAAAAGQSFLGRAATGAAVQAAATPLAPGMYVTQSQERAMQNGGQWTDAKNLAPELIKAGITNAILGQLSGLSGELPTAARIGIGAAAMPTEQAAADAVLTVGEKALKKAGVSDEWLTETKYGTVGQLARGEYGDGMASLVMQIAMGAGFAAAHGNEKPIFPKFKDALNSLAAKGVPPEKAAEVLKQAITEPKPAEGEKPKSELQTDAVDEFASLLDNNDKLKQAMLSSNGEKPAGPETAKIGPQTADLQKLAPEPVQQPISQPEKKSAYPLAIPQESPRQASRPLWEMGYDELKAAEEAKKAADKDVDVQILGKEEADRWNKAHRRANSRHDDVRLKAEQDIADIESKLSKKDVDRLYGIGEETGPTADDYAEYRKAIGDVQSDSPYDMAQTLSYILPKLPREGIDPSTMEPKQQVAYAQLREAYSQIKKNGWDAEFITREALKRAGSRYSDPHDAYYVLERFLKQEPQKPKQKGQARLGGTRLALPENKSTDSRANKDLEDFFASASAKDIVKESPKDLRHNPDLDAIFAEPAKPEKKPLPKEWVRPANDLLDEFMAIPTEKPKQETATFGPKRLPVELGQPAETAPRMDGQRVTRMQIMEGGKEIGEFKGFMSGRTLHVEWLGSTGAAATDKAAKGSLGTARMRETFRKLADAYPDAVAMKYTPAEGRLGAGKTKWIDLEKIREQNLSPDEKEARNAIHDAIQSGQSPAAIAEAIQAGNAAAEETQGSNGPVGERQPAAQAEPAGNPTPQAAPAESGPDRSPGGAEPARGMERLGHETEIEVEGGHPIPARYELRELKDIVASHGITENGNFKNRAGEYPAGLQPRDYSNDPTEQAKVRRAALELSPAKIINTGPEATGGPTTITQDGNIAINGNGRQLALEEAARIGRFGKYKDYLEKKASQFGIDPAVVKGMDQPVLVRVVNIDPTSQTAAEFARRGNVSSTQGQSPERTAASLGGLIDNSVIDALKLEGDTTFSEAVNESGGKEFRQRLSDALPSTERNNYFTADDKLTDAGKELVRNMLLSKLLPIETIERMKADMKAESRSIEGAIPQLLQLSKNDAIDPRKPLVEAINLLARNPRIKSLADADNVLTQNSLFGGKAETISPAGRMMLDFILKDGHKPTVFRKKLGNVISDVSQATTGLFAEPGGKFDPVESVARNLGVEERPGAKFDTGEGAKEPSSQSLYDRADQIEKNAWKKIEEKTKGKLFSGFDPSLIAPVVEIFGARIVKGAIKFADFSKALIQKFGDAVKPHLQEIWDRSHAYAEELRNGQNPPPPDQKPSNSPGNAHPPYDTVSPLKNSFEGQIPPDVTGIKNAITEKERAARGLPPSMEADPVGHSFPELVDQVNTIARVDPERITDLVQSLLKNPRPIKDIENAMLLRRQVELGKQYDQLAEDWKAAKAANDSVATADAENALNESRQKLRDLYDINKKVGTENSRGLNARKMLMAKDYSLAKMTTDYELSVGRPMNANDAAIVQKAHDRIKELEQRIADLQKKAEVKPEPKPPTFGRRTEAAKAEVDAAWEALRKATKGKLFSNPAFDPEVINAAAGVAKAYIKLGVAKFSDFVEAVQQKSGHQASDEEKNILQAAWDKAQSESAVKPEPPKTQTKEQRQVDAEYRTAVTGWAEQLHKNRQANDTAVAKGIRHAGNLTDFLRSVMLGGDLPPIFRQGLVATLGHPVVSTKAFLKSAKAFKSETTAHEVLSDLALRENSRNGKYARDLGMDVTNIHGLDEFLHSSWIKKVPGFAHLERWHSAYLSQLRADLYDMGVSALSRSGRPTDAEGKIIGNLVNVATGKGELYGAEKIVNGLNKVFLAPRWVASRFEFALGQPLLHGIREHGLQPRARAYVAKEYARAMAGMAFVYGIGGMLVAQGLATIDKNSLAADFGDIRIGNTRINPTASLSNAWRFVTRMWEAKKSANDTANPNNRKEVAMNELRSKLAPIPANIWTAIEIRDKETGKTKKGPPPWYPQNWKDFAIDAVEPLSIQDTIKACNDLGLPKGLVVGLLASLGANVKVYGK